MTRFLFFLLVVLIVSCGVKERDSSSVFFAGEIVNPTNDKVVLYRGDEPLDTAYLDQFNRFTIELDSVVEGLHHFQHHPEEQYVYLEKGDSIQLRLNTINFDESLVFSGTGEEINNFIVDRKRQGASMAWLRASSTTRTLCVQQLPGVAVKGDEPLLIPEPKRNRYDTDASVVH